MNETFQYQICRTAFWSASLLAVGHRSLVANTMQTGVCEMHGAMQANHLYQVNSGKDLAWTPLPE
jgi:hypothetical protein